MEYLDYRDDHRVVLIHFNPNHDPRNGQFTRNGGSVSNASNSHTIWNERYIKAGKIALGIGLTAIGVMLIPKLQDKASGKLYQWSKRGKAVIDAAEDVFLDKNGKVITDPEILKRIHDLID